MLNGRLILCTFIISLFFSIGFVSVYGSDCSSCGGGDVDLKTLFDIDNYLNIPGDNCGLNISWPGPGQNPHATSGPYVSGFVNGDGPSPIFLGNGASHIDTVDFYLPLNGIDWYHQRVFSSISTSSLTWQGEGWWCNEMINLSVDGAEGASDVDIEMDPHKTLSFTYSAGSWTCDNDFLYVLTFSSGDDEYILTGKDGQKHVFHDSAATNAGKLKRIEDPYGNDWAFTYTSGNLTDITIDVVEGNDHKVTYTYFTSGDNRGQIQYIKVYKSTTTTDANLIGKIEYAYHDSTSDDYGTEDDLMKVTISQKGTADGDGVLSITGDYYYRYYKGTYSNRNPGTDHQLKYVLNPENAKRLNDDKGDPLTQSLSDFGDYANVFYKYDTSSRVSETKERMDRCGGSGSSAGGVRLVTSYTWTANGGSPDLDTWNLHCVADRDDDSRVIFDVNSLYQILTWVVQDEDDGSPATELIWHFDYGTSGVTENRLTCIHFASNCTDYDESSPYSVTLSSSAGVVYDIDYDYATSTYDGYPEKVQLKEGTSGTATTLFAYGRSITERPCLATSITEYESSGETDGRTTSLSYSFYDSGGDKIELKEIDITYPSVSSAKNGPGVSAENKYYYDKRTGALRWDEDGEGFIKFYAYDDETGMIDLQVADVDTSSLSSDIDDNWDGVTHGGLAADDTTPYSRSGGGTALDLTCSKEIDWLGRTRKYTDRGGMITYYVYKNNETRVYPAWDTTSYDTLLPVKVSLLDEEGRAEEEITLKNSITPSTTSNEPNGSESYSNSDISTWRKNSYDICGRLSYSDSYHSIPSSGSGTRYSNYYRSTLEYDEMGRRQYTIADVSDESTYDREQVTKTSYDFMGRRTKSEEGVSDNTHDITASKPTLVTTAEYYYDDPDSDSTPENGEGDGNLSWVRSYYGTSAGEYNDTYYVYDQRNRQCITEAPLSPHSLVKYDNLNRGTASGTYSTTTNLSVGDDPATTDNTNRLSLNKTYYDEWGRVYKTEMYDDPSDSTPADALTTNTYYDRRSKSWATDPPNTGINFTEYDGAGRTTKSYRGTQFDTNKYSSSQPDYPDDDEGIVQLTEYTRDAMDKVEKTITKELNHDDTNGMDTDGSDFIRTYRYSWYDDAHRLTDTANYGTYSSDGWKDNSTAPTRGSEAPSSSDTCLVTTYSYDSDGNKYEITDPKGIKTRFTFDSFGKKVALVEDYGTGTELNRKTEYSYNGLGNIVQQIHDPDADNTFANGTWTQAGTDTDQETEHTYADSQNAGRLTKIEYPDTGDVDFTYHVDGTYNTKTDQNGTVLTSAYDALRRKTAIKVTTLGTYTGGAAQVDGSIRSVTWKYDDEGQVTYVTCHTDDTPDTSSWTDAANQIKYTYNDAGKLTKEEPEVDSAVDGSTLAVEYSYGTDYSTGNYHRLNYIEYPDGRKIWNGYTHSGGASTFQDTINDKFNRIGQIAKDNSGSIGDLIAEYDFTGLSRMVRRDHDEESGAYGNDTRMDLWHGTAGDYDGFDRFGRIVDMKFTEYSGTETVFDRREYTYDRNYNRESIKHTQYAANGQSFTYDDLNRVTEAKRGLLNTSDAVYASNMDESFSMDHLGNYTPTAGGVKINSDSACITHTVTATNEISVSNKPNASGTPNFIEDEFDSSLNAFWSQDTGTWSISSGYVNVDSLSSGEAILLAEADIDMSSYVLDVKFPTSSSTNKAGLLLAYDSSSNDGYVVLLDRSAGKLSIHQISSGTIGSALDSDDMTINDSTDYTIRVMQRQRNITAVVDGQSTYFSYSSTSDLGTGECGFYSDKTDVKFDDFYVYNMTAIDPKYQRIIGPGVASIVLEELYVVDSPYFGDVFVSDFSDDDYMVQVDMDLNSGTYADVWFRRVDPNNGYVVRLDSSLNAAVLSKWEDGNLSVLSTTNTFPGSSCTAKIKVSGTSLKVWFDGSLKFDRTDSTFSAGGVGFSGDTALFDNLKIGYDNNSDDDIDDAGDDVVLDDDFSTKERTFTYDDTGNLIDDGTFVYIYDAWNKLVKIRASEDSDVTVQEAEFDGSGRRIKKVVTNSGDYDGTTIYLYNGNQIVETRDGSSNVVQQFVHGKMYMDELVMVRVTNKGELYVHQDANWNIIALTDLGGHLVERYVYETYGQMIVHQETSYGDYDGDQDVDTTDRDAYDGSSPSGAERILDLDFDGDVDATDSTLFDNNLTTGISRHPGRITTGVEQPFGHQGLIFDTEVSSYQNRYRQYDPQFRKFLQRDPAGYRDGMSLYEYCRSNPILHADPAGLHIMIGMCPASTLVVEQESLFNTPSQLPEWFKESVGIDVGWYPEDYVSTDSYYSSSGKTKCIWDITPGKFDLLPNTNQGSLFWHGEKLEKTQRTDYPMWEWIEEIPYPNPVFYFGAGPNDPGPPPPGSTIADLNGYSKVDFWIHVKLDCGKSMSVSIRAISDPAAPGGGGQVEFTLTLICGSSGEITAL